MLLYGKSIETSDRKLAKIRLSVTPRAKKFKRGGVIVGKAIDDDRRLAALRLINDITKL